MPFFEFTACGMNSPSLCSLVIINMQDCVSVREMLFSTRLSVHLSHSSCSSFISAPQQDGRAHLGLIVGLPLLTNPAHCRRNKQINNQGLEKGTKWTFLMYREQFKGFQSNKKKKHHSPSRDTGESYGDSFLD